MRSYTSKPGQQIPFDLDGVTFHTNGGASLLELSEVARLADTDLVDPAAAAAIAGFFRSALGGQEYQRFRDHVSKHGTDPETLMHIMQDLVEEAGQTPSQRPSPSTGGPTAIGSTYRVVSDSGVREFPLTAERQQELREAVARAESAAG